MDGLQHAEAWLKLNALELSTRRTYSVLDAFAGDPTALFAASRAEWRERVPELTEKQFARLSEMQGRSFAKELRTLASLGGSLVTQADPCYPTNLRQLPDAPPVLIVRGELHPEDKFSVAIVGSRRSTQYGHTLARNFARELAAHGLAVVSGGARGVDTHAHEGALAGGGRTVVFLGSGVDVNYPAENRSLFERIARGGGAVVSEYPLGAQPEPWRFPARNRLISGMSLGVVVLESPLDSGSLITAREAGDQGRDVFAVPGPVGDGRNAGCHRLIQEGAKLVETVDDILSELGLPSHGSSPTPSGHVPAPPLPHLPPEQRQILDLLTLQPRQVDSMIAESGLSAPQVVGILTLLEMRGLARRVPGNAFVRVL